MATGKRAGARRAAPRRSGPSVNTSIAALAAGITACVVAWGYLVYTAIDFGTSARSGSSTGWALLALASLGAMACLFVGLLLASRLSAALGLARNPAQGGDEDTEEPTPGPQPPPRKPGGRRAAR
ncbi:hypothetical protein [Nocardioides campestrisoli]|uniref:hypothetical protein n=1 Tax=Nocardioides campestrisoli TaxID=2736757 RepID=UPI0015E714A8|nr:hypothetical protein [Nocardioides campestrisoli]